MVQKRPKIYSKWALGPFGVHLHLPRPMDFGSLLGSPCGHIFSHFLVLVFSIFRNPFLTQFWKKLGAILNQFWKLFEPIFGTPWKVKI